METKMPKWNLVQSVVKAVDILEIVAESENGMRLNEIAEKIGQKTTTAHNLIRTLTAQGILEKDAGNIYTLGQRLEELVSGNLRKRIYGRAVSAMKELSEEFPEAVLVLTEKAYSDIILRVRISPDRPGLTQKPLDRSFFSYASVSCLIFMAFAESGIENVLSNYPFTEYGIHVWGTEEKLDEYLRQVRRDGCSRDNFSNAGGFRFAVPVFNAGGSLLFSLGMDFKNMEVKEDRRKKIISKAVEISKKISNHQI